MLQGPKLIETVPFQHLASKSPWILTASCTKKRQTLLKKFLWTVPRSVLISSIHITLSEPRHTIPPRFKGAQKNALCS